MMMGVAQVIGMKPIASCGFSTAATGAAAAPERLAALDTGVVPARLPELPPPVEGLQASEPNTSPALAPVAPRRKSRRLGRHGSWSGVGSSMVLSPRGDRSAASRVRLQPYGCRTAGCTDSEHKKTGRILYPRHNDRAVDFACWQAGASQAG